MSNNFHALRLGLAFGVLYSHSYGLLLLREPVICGRTLGNLSVHCFFVISGYLVAGSFLHCRGPLDFLWRRTLRILPALVVAYAFSILMLRWHGHYVTNPTPYIANGSVWTIPWEIVMYLLLLLAGVLGLVTRSASSAAYACGLIVFGSSLASTNDTFLVVVPFFLLFLGGVFIKLNERHLDMKKLAAVGLLIELALNFPGVYSAIYGLVPFLYGPNLSGPQIAEFAHVVALPFAVIGIAKYAPLSLPLKDDYSYGVYLFAWPVQQSVISYLSPISPTRLFVLSGTATLVIAVLSWRLVEKWALKLKFVQPHPPSARLTERPAATSQPREPEVAREIGVITDAAS